MSSVTSTVPIAAGDRDTMGLIERFEDESLGTDEFGHREHVRVAWGMLRVHGLPRTLERFSAGLRRFTARHGVANRYHETLTWALLFLIHERMAELKPRHGWEDFEAASDDLLHEPRDLLLRHYPAEQLDSDRARRSFLLPVRAPGEE